ncbi:MAG: acyltransferase family protein [Gammaproteobacteria bacterium]
MNKTYSLYLDLVRFGAAFAVFLSHFAFTRITGGSYSSIRELNLGSDAVILFFVLSGYVIAYVAETREKDLSSFTLSRLSRLYSVVLPALILTFILDKCGSIIDPVSYDGWWYADDMPALRFFANLFFINELWFYGIKPFTNSAFWSLGYEFWYYVLFATAFYFKGCVRLILIMLTLLIAGPKIMILLPIWLMGVWVYKFNKHKALTEKTGWLLFLFPVAAYIMIKYIGLDHQLLNYSKDLFGAEFVERKLWHSDEFLISYLYGVLVSMNFIGLKSISHRLEKPLSFFEKPIRFWAGFTFSIYLFHYPLLQFFHTIYGFEIDDPIRHILLFFSIISVIVSLGSVTESNKHQVKNILKKFIPANSKT